MSRIDNPTRKGRILSVKVERRTDTDGDYNKEGKYSNTPGPADRTVDRKALGHMGRGEYRYFIAANSGKDTGNPASVREDYDRTEALNRGEWCYLGIMATANIVLPGSDVVQRIASGGLWGIESDSGDDYFAEVEAEELAGLRGELETVGFSKRQIDLAFRAVEQVNR
jgi:hypothetical protein